jgi:hypothetical protein
MDRRSFIASSGLLFAPVSWASCNDDLAGSQDWNVWVRHRREREYLAAVGEARGTTADDIALVRRIIVCYRKTFAIEHYGNGMWRELFSQRQGGLHRLLMEADAESVAKVLRDPASNYLHYGFEHTIAEHTKVLRESAQQRAHLALMCKMNLVTLGEALGLERIDNPEAYPATPKQKIGPPTDDLVKRIESVIGFRITFPNLFPNEYGLATDRGVAGFRSIQALYQAYRIKSLNPGSVVEIGAGLGRTAQYSYVAGIRDYTIVDLPFTSVSQAYFLGRVLGPQAVVLDGEAPRKEAIKIISPETFLRGKRRHALFVNVDSMTEMPLEVAKAYYEAFKHRGERMLSINHEHNSHTVHDSMRELSHTRYPYWMRRGYIEELYSAA